MSLLWILIIILIVIGLGGWGWQGSPVYGTPYFPGVLGVIVLILVVLLLTGRLH
jgi:hypothetical protein